MSAEAVAIGQKYSKASQERLAAMAAALIALDADGIAGDVVECGVWQGGHIILARKLSPRRLCWCFDTFSGMTAPTELDVSRSGWSASDRMQEKIKRGVRWANAPLDQVMENFRVEGVLDPNLVRFVAGDVAETLQRPANLPDQIALLRLDTDWYESTKIELEVLYPRLVSGGRLIIDDYGHWMGARKAVDDYFREMAIKPELSQIDYTGVIHTKA